MELTTKLLPRWPRLNIETLKKDRLQTVQLAADNPDVADVVGSRVVGRAQGGARGGVPGPYSGSRSRAVCVAFVPVARAWTTSDSPRSRLRGARTTHRQRHRTRNMLSRLRGFLTHDRTQRGAESRDVIMVLVSDPGWPR